MHTAMTGDTGVLSFHTAAVIAALGDDDAVLEVTKHTSSYPDGQQCEDYEFEIQDDEWDNSIMLSRIQAEHLLATVHTSLYQEPEAVHLAIQAEENEHIETLRGTMHDYYFIDRIKQVVGRAIAWGHNPSGALTQVAQRVTLANEYIAVMQGEALIICKAGYDAHIRIERTIGITDSTALCTYFGEGFSMQLLEDALDDTGLGSAST